jgi:cell division protein FtsB
LPLSSSAAAYPAALGLKLQILIAALIAVLVALHYLLWLAEDGVQQTYALRIAIQAQTEENVVLNERNRALEADVLDLKNGLMAIEERARSEMGMIRPDETFYRILDQPLPKPAKVAPVKPDAPTRKPPTLGSPPVATARPSAPSVSSPPRIVKPSTNPTPPR